MPLPVAHGLVGASVVAVVDGADACRNSGKRILLGAALAILPDVDFFFVWVIGLGANWHRGFTHSILFALIAALFVTLLAGEARLKGFIAYWLACLSHGALDALTTKNNIGVEFWWPLCAIRYRTGAFDHWNYQMRMGQQDWWGFFTSALRITMFEILAFTPVFLLALLVKSLRLKRTAARAARRTTDDPIFLKER
ncbi:MAG TPA: metal-dependent hydrolase [Blastocatellia bacterium]|jgi:membrane-bound metal-dependent hydrolase YbcI (DUF457 family)